MKIPFFLLAFFFVTLSTSQDSNVSLVVLGTVQDGGSPHIGCQNDCCKELFDNPDPTRKVVSLGIIDHENQKTFLFEATPDMPDQLKLLKEASNSESETPTGIFLTHAHMGHYAGLMYLGREALGAKSVRVHTMPKMKSFIETNGPWSQLVDLKNVVLSKLEHEKTISLTPNLKVRAFLVPHRDEFSETVGYKIMGPNKSVLFIPDIDKWSKWSTSIVEEIKMVDIAFLDATFYDSEEVNNRDMSEIPHPFVVESMQLFQHLSIKEKSKIHFIHFNHTNPILNTGSKAHREVASKGFKVAQFAQKFRL